MNKKPSMDIKKIILICIIILIVFGISVLAGTTKINNVKIKFANDYEFTIITSKTKVSEILEEAHIILEDNETVTPKLEDNIDNNSIIISIKGEEPLLKAQIEEDIISNSEEILANYTAITEKIIVEIVEIPFETITKDVSNGTELTTNKILQYGKNGQKEITYKITYKNDIEIKREELSSKIIKEPVNKIVQVQSKIISSRASFSRTGVYGQSGIYKVTAYCACMQCCGKTNGITASGVKATAGRTIAAPGIFKFGTKLLINGVEYTVEDRGGAIQGNRIDIYMDTHYEALAWGVRYLQVEVLN